MEWLVAFGHWLHAGEAGWWFGLLFIFFGLTAVAAALVWRYGDVRMGPDPLPPDTVEIRIPQTSYVPHYERWPLQSFVAAVDEATSAVIDIIDTVEIRPANPLDATAELELIDESTPLFYAVRRPRPYDHETFTEGLRRAQIRRAMAAKDLR